MAQPLAYAPPPAPPGQDAFTAEDDLRRLLDTLHESGTLRVLNGLLAQFQDVMAVVLKGLNTDEGRAGLANLLTLAKLLGRIDADGLDRFVAALDRALEAAGGRIDEKDDAPGSLSVLAKLRDPDVRRGLDATLTLVGTLGKQLHDPQPPVHSAHDGRDGARP
ncbi:DUF1641 domain-containing protein [Rubrivirga marina]|uniref:DUF1641 domain-containing protein n=1 Tax=Rubrivirga marina TaxID=1196024 RepID=A0A271IXB7_9BACT|nr:DUF1641 domain-containing protein [Rubrivirga marina]PAP75464.1 hypothetical protein BSZ37_02885 [Rubrivirga marina]